MHETKGTDLADRKLMNRNWPETEQLWRTLVEKKGFILIRLKPTSKTPHGTRWSDKVRHKSFEDIGLQSSMNAGAVCGKLSGIIVLDIDNPVKFNTLGLKTPDTFTVKTGKGFHHYYRIPQDNIQYRNRRKETYDIRAEMGYVVAPGSIHPDGGEYEIVKEVDIADAPEWLLEQSKENTSEAQRHHLRLKHINSEFGDTEEIDINSLNLSPDIHDLITEGPPEGSDRSKKDFAVITALLKAGCSDKQIRWIFTEYPISAKSDEHPDKYHYIQTTIDNALDLIEVDLPVITARKECIGSTDVNWEGIAKQAHLRALALLRHYGNQPSKNHEEALYKVSETFTNLLCGKLTGRIALPLPPGYGKTTSITAFLSVLNSHGFFKYGLKRIVVMSTKVEQLCEGYRYAKELGIPEEYMAIVHSYRYDPQRCDPRELPANHASEKAVLDAERPIVFLTHAKTKKDGGEVKGATPFSEYQTYLEDRDLAIWDESFISTDSEVVHSGDFEDELAILKSRAERPQNMVEDIHSAIAYLEKCKEVIKEECERLQDNNDERRVLPFPGISQSERMSQRNACLRIVEEQVGSRGSKIKTIKRFYKMLQDDMVINYKASDNAVVLRGSIVIPDTLANVVILDASAEINYMMLLDKSIALPADMPELELSYQDTSFYRINHHAGRGTIEKECASGERGLINVILEIILARPGEPFLFFHHRHRDITVINCRATLEDAMQKAGVDINATDSEGRRLYNWLTLGNETASNSYSHCDNVVFMGLMHLSDEVLRGKILSQTRDITTKIDTDFVTSIEKAELVYALHQGSCRCRIRHIRGDKACAGNVWYTYQDDSLIPMLTKVFPKANWETHRSNAWRPHNKSTRLERFISEYLSTVSSSVNKISNRMLKAIAESSMEFGKTLFSETMNAISNDPGVPWVKEKQSMVRVN